MRDRVNIGYLLLAFEFFGLMILNSMPRNDLYYMAAFAINAAMLKVLERGCLGKKIWFDIFRMVFIQFVFQIFAWIIYQANLQFHLHVHAKDFLNPANLTIVAATFLWLIFGGSDDKPMARPSDFWLLFGDFGVGNQASKEHQS